MGGKAAQKIAMDAGARMQSVVWCNCSHTVCEDRFAPDGVAALDGVIFSARGILLLAPPAMRVCDKMIAA